MKRPTKALADLDRALELDPGLSGARLNRAALRLRQKDRDGAKADLDRVDQAIAPQAQARLGMASLFLALDDPARAIAQLDRWLAAHPNEATRGGALNTRCWARVRLGIELDRALDDCDEAVDSDRDNAAYLDSRAWAELRLGRSEKALADFDRSLAAHPGAAWSLYGRGLVRTRMGDAARGEADLAAARQAQADIDAAVAKAGLVAGSTPRP